MLDILTELSNTTKKTEKQKILSSLSPEQAKMFKRIAFLTYDPSIDFYVKEFKSADEHHDAVPLGEVLDDLEKLIAGRVFTGNQAKKWVESQHELLSQNDAEVFRRVVRRDLRCGISAKSINKQFPGTVYEHPYMRCSSFSAANLKNVKYPCVSQTKMDGLYCDVIITDKVEYRSRNGSFLLYNNEQWDDKLIELAQGNVLMGEVVATEPDSDKLLDRASSNGYLNSNDVDLSRVRFFIWDMVPVEEFEKRKCTKPYIERLHNAVNLLNQDLEDPQWKIVDSVMCHDQDTIINHFRENREAGEEGTIIKDQNSPWKPGTSKDQIKVKVVFEAEFRLVGYKEGTGKNKGRLGSLEFESDEGEVVVSAGTGFKEKDRDQLWSVVDQAIKEKWIATIRANDITYPDPGEKMSLFLPRFVEWRTDKNEADSREKIVEQVQSFTDALKMIK